MKLPKLISLEEVRTAMEPDADTLKAVADDLERKAAHDREQLEVGDVTEQASKEAEVLVFRI